MAPVRISMHMLCSQDGASTYPPSHTDSQGNRATLIQEVKGNGKVGEKSIPTHDPGRKGFPASKQSMP